MTDTIFQIFPISLIQIASSVSLQLHHILLFHPFDNILKLSYKHKVNTLCYSEDRKLKGFSTKGKLIE